MKCNGALLASRNGTPLADRERLFLAQAPFRERYERGERRQDVLLAGILDAERADCRPPDRPAVPAEMVGDRADVRSARDLQVELDERRLVADDAQLVDRGTADRHLDGDAAPLQLVGALALDLDRGGLGHAQLDLALERLDLLEGGERSLLDDLTLPVPVVVRRPSRISVS